MKLKINIIRVDPIRRTIAAMPMRCAKNAVPEIRRVVRVKEIGWRELLEVDGTVLVVSGGLDVSEEMAGWKLVGGEDTAGIGILFGKGPGGAMTDVPVDRAWVEKRIRWLAGEDVQTARDRAAETLPMLSPDLRVAVIRAVPSPSDGALWLLVDDSHLFDAALALGITTPSTKGQRLSPMGAIVHDMLYDAVQ